MTFKSSFWVQFSVINLLIVALLGLLMRYKIGFEFPFLNQKYIQFSHSHFAFSGWISHSLMALMASFLEKKAIENEKSFLKKYNYILSSNLICAYGMLVSFFIQGYGLISIVFSTSSILIAFVFAYYFYQDLKMVSKEDLSKTWFKASLLFNVISSIGTFALAYMMMTKNIHQNEYLASIYYYLHFQYNGWFFFSCMGLLYHLLDLKLKEYPELKHNASVFAIACIPAYFLSLLWIKLPDWLYFITVIASVVQVAAWFYFLVILVKKENSFLIQKSLWKRYTLLFLVFATTIKFLLQLGSVIPDISRLAFGFRPIVIAYLHLVLLAMISLFLLFYMFEMKLFKSNRLVKSGIIVFSVGVFLNEIVLALQGIGSFSYTPIPFSNEILFGISVIMVSGITMTVTSILKKE